MAATLMVEQPGPQDQRIDITVMAPAILQLLTLMGLGLTAVSDEGLTPDLDRIDGLRSALITSFVEVHTDPYTDSYTDPYGGSTMAGHSSSVSSESISSGHPSR